MALSASTPEMAQRLMRAIGRPDMCDDPRFATNEKRVANVDALDAIIGDPTLYTRQDMVEASWSVVEPIQNAWREDQAEFPNYAAGSWGPAAADEMLARRGHVWRKP